MNEKINRLVVVGHRDSAWWSVFVSVCHVRLYIKPFETKSFFKQTNRHWFGKRKSEKKARELNHENCTRVMMMTIFSVFFFLGQRWFPFDPWQWFSFYDRYTHTEACVLSHRYPIIFLPNRSSYGTITPACAFHNPHREKAFIYYFYLCVCYFLLACSPQPNVHDVQILTTKSNIYYFLFVCFIFLDHFTKYKRIEYRCQCSENRFFSGLCIHNSVVYYFL